jgi:small subunit ribosomal protein S4
MARYTGPKTRIARKFGEAIFGDDKAFEEEVTHLDNTGWLKRGKKI